MTISMRSTKAQMYAEIKRLRALCARQEQQLRAVSQPRRTPDLLERRAKLETLKSLAKKFHCPARLRDGVIEIYSKKRRCWVTVPEGVQP